MKSAIASPPRQKNGYALLLAILGVTLLTIFLTVARMIWESEAQRDLEEELMFRARQYVTAIQLYLRKHNNIPPENLEILLKEKFIRQLYKDPMTASGKWDLVLRERAGSSNKILVAPLEMLVQLKTRGFMAGVCSTSPTTSFRNYRGRKKYNEWAFYIGDNPKEEMPDIEYLGKEKKDSDDGDKEKDIAPGG
jgi:hypothetical protein